MVERTPNKSQHTKLTLEKNILPPLLQGFELATFCSRVRRSDQQAIPAPKPEILGKAEILSRIAQTAAALTRLKPVWSDRSISLSSKIRLMRSLVTSIFLYACESWTLTAELQRGINHGNEVLPQDTTLTQTKTMLPTRKSVPRSSRQSAHTKTS